MTSTSSKFMIMDACVLIDFVKTDQSILQLITKHVGQAYVVNTVLEEVKDLDNHDDLVRLGLIVLEPELEDLFSAAEEEGPTSFQDKLCMLSAKRHNLICVTNDKNLRKLCQQEEVDICWGLQLLAKLHNAGGITTKGAKEIAEEIHEQNTQHITKKILEDFIAIIKRQEN